MTSFIVSAPVQQWRVSSLLRHGLLDNAKENLCFRARPMRGMGNTNVNRGQLVRNALGFGFLSPRPPDATNSSLLPSPDALCACGSTKTYGNCCRRFHTAQLVPSQAEDLLRSRYSAYAYRLPSYIMKTTHSSAIELDRRMWKREIMDFCKEYQFVGGIDLIETQMPAPYTTRILFR